MLGIGLPELIIILIIALVVVGPERLPELGRQVGKVVRDLRRIYANLRSELGPEFDEIEQGIRDIRSLNPRAQIGEYGRTLLDDLSADAPEIKRLASAPKLDLEKIGRDVLRDDLLDKPLAETRSDGATQATKTTSSDAEVAPVSEAKPVARPVETNGHYE